MTTREPRPTFICDMRQYLADKEKKGELPKDSPRCWCGSFSEDADHLCKKHRFLRDAGLDVVDNIDNDYDTPSRESEWKRKL